MHLFVLENTIQFGVQATFLIIINVENSLNYFITFDQLNVSLNRKYSLLSKKVLMVFMDCLINICFLISVQLVAYVTSLRVLIN